MNKLYLLLLLLTPFSGCSQKTETAPPKSGLIFQSGFESDSKVVEQSSKSAKIVGKDKSLKNLSDWENDLGMHLNIGYFNIQYQGGNESQRLAEITTDPANSSNKALRFWIKEPNVNPKKGRIQANIYNNNEIKNVDYSIRLFLPSDFNTVKSAPFKVKWLTLMEFWNNANWRDENYKFRISVNLQKPGTGTDSLIISVKSQIKDTKTGKWKKPYVWESVNKSFIVPVEKWMRIDVHFVEGNAEHGRFTLSITPDGESTTVVHDIKNFTHHPNDPAPDGLSHFNPFKLYTSDDLIEYVTNSGKLLNVYWDDFKLSINGKNSE
jgi:hypothetical protein